MRAGWLGVGAVLLFACGSSRGPTGSPSTGTSDAGSVDSSDAGGGPVATADAGTPVTDAGTPATDAGTIAPGDDAGTPPADAGTIIGGSTPDAGAPPDECAGLMPASLPAPIVPAMPGNGGCNSGTSDDGSGNFALFYEYGSGPVYPGIAFFQVQNGRAVQVGDEFRGSDEAGYELYSQPSGFTIYDFGGAPPSAGMCNYSRSGQGLGCESITPRNPDHVARDATAIDPSGGTVSITSVADDSGKYVTSFVRYDASGALQVEKTIDDTLDLNAYAAGVTLAGNTLAVAVMLDPSGQPDGEYYGRWLARDGTPMTAWFGLHAALGYLQFLLGGGLIEISYYPGSGGAKIFGNVWMDGATVPQPPPAWLAAEDGSTSFFSIREGKGYALYDGRCTGLSLFTAKGKSCGCFQVPKLTGHATIGRDGSLIVPVSESCHYELYPLLFH
jgi:hypothetical protein